MKKLVFICLLGLAAFTKEAAAQGTVPTCNPYPKTINVSGSAEMSVVPDEIYVQVDLKEYKKKGENKTPIDKIKADFLAACRAAGIPDSNINVMNFEGANANLMVKRRQKDPDMIATISYQVKFTKASKMDDLVNRMDDEATNNFSVVNVSHSKMSEFRKQLKIEAIKAARAKAMYLCEAVGEQLGTAITINEPAEYGGYEPRVQRMASQSAMSNNTFATYDSAGGAEGIDFKKLKIRYEMQMTFAIK